MAETGDRLRITQTFNQAGNLAYLVSFFQWASTDTEVPVVEDNIAYAYHYAMAYNIVPIFLHNTAKLVRTLVDNLDNPTGLYGEYIEDFVGTQSGDAAPSFVAVDVKQNVGSRLTRSGRKRLPFIPESLSQGNTCLITGGDADDIAAFFGAPIALDFPETSDSMGVLSPVIVGRTLMGVPPKYELDLTRVQLVSSAQIVGVTSQTSRKV